MLEKYPLLMASSNHHRNIYHLILYGMNVVSFQMANLIRAPWNELVISPESIHCVGVAIYFSLDAYNESTAGKSE